MYNIEFEFLRYNIRKLYYLNYLLYDLKLPKIVLILEFNLFKYMKSF